MSCWQSTILMLYYRERVTFALPCVLPVRPIYGPIMCNMLKCCVGGLRICTTIVLSHQTHRSLARLYHGFQDTRNMLWCVCRAEALSVGLRVCVHGSANFILAPHGMFYHEPWLHSRIFLCLHCKNIACFNPLMVVRVAIIY